MVFGRGQYRVRGGRSVRNPKRYKEDTGYDSNPKYQGRHRGRPQSYGRGGKNSRHDGRTERSYDSESTYDNTMDEESATYFSIVLGRMNEPFEDEEEKEVFVENVLEQMQGKETIVALSSLGSRNLQKILELNTKVSVIENIIVALRNDVEDLSRNQFGSLALQALLKNCLHYSMKDGVENKPVIDFVVGTAEFCIYSYPNILDHPFQNYVLKTVIHILSGNTSFSFKRNQFDLEPQFVEVPPIFKETLEKLSKCILSVDKLEEFLYVDIFAFLIQHLLKASSHFPEICKYVVDSILEVTLSAKTSDEQLHPYLTSPSASYVIQAAVDHFDKKQCKMFRKRLIIKQLVPIIEHKQANNILKTIIRKSPSKHVFEKLFTKLQPHFKLIFQLEHDTLLVAIADCCVRFDALQAKFVLALKEVLECSEGDKQDYFILCLLHMLHYNQYVQAESENIASVSLNGSLLVQRLLHFSKPIKHVMAFLNMSLDNLKRITCDPKGCHVIDSFMKSKFVGEKRREKLVEKIKDISITLACSPYGSRSIDTIWENSNLKTKIMLAESLAKNMEILSSNKFGKFILKNLALHHFKNRYEDWKQVQSSQEKKRKLFKDIVDNDHEQIETKKKKVMENY